TSFVGLVQEHRQALAAALSGGAGAIAHVPDELAKSESAGGLALQSPKDTHGDQDGLQRSERRMRLRSGGDHHSFNDGFGLLRELGEIAMGGKRATLRL